MRETHNRISFFDTYKGLLMILVIIGHFSFFDYEDKIITLIYSFHMPAFIIISGFLSKNENTDSVRTIIRKKFTSCIVPYFIFYFITYIIIPHSDIMQYVSSLKTTFSGVADSNYSMNLPLWFLTFFFVNTTVFELLKKLSSYISNSITPTKNYRSQENTLSRELILFIFCLLVTILTFIYSRILKLGRIIYNTEIALFCIMFNYFGHIIKIVSEKIKTYINDNNKKRKFIILNFILFIIITIIWYKLALYNKRIDLNARNFRQAHLMYINAMLGFYIFSIISFLLDNIPIIKNIFRYLGKNSIYILAYHIPSVFYMNILFNEFLPSNLTKNLDTLNMFSFTYKILTAILFSLFMGLIHKNIINYIKNNYEKQNT